MALDFPASPVFGEVFTAGNSQWQWDGTKWVAIASGLVIPDAPTDGTLYGRQNLGWDPVPISDGVEEAPADGTIYGRQDAGWVPTGGGGGPPFMGVTDGSDAGPGEIGEVISFNTTISVTVSGGSVVIGSITLTAGDWDVCGEVFFSVTGGGNDIQRAYGAITTSAGGFPQSNIASSQASGGAGFPGAGEQLVLALRPARILLSAPVTYNLLASGGVSGGSLLGWGNMIARRMR